jgi:RNA-directed DNA polymerase
LRQGRPHKAVFIFYLNIIMTGSARRKEGRYQRRLAQRNLKKDAFLSNYDNFALICDPNNLKIAFKKSRCGVQWKESVQRYEMNLLQNITETVRKLEAGENITLGFVEFFLNERGKNRRIRSVHISERVPQKVTCDRVLVPILSRPLIYDNGASLKKKGLHFSFRRLITHLSKYYRKYKTNEGYCLQIDFSKYFDSIQHKILFQGFNKYIKDRRIIKLLYDFITPFGDGISLGLGSQVSQISAIFFTNPIDHLIKEKYRIKYYGRYMDDLYLIHPDKKYLLSCLEGIKTECEKLGIKVNLKKTKITKLKDGVHFLKGIYSVSETGKIIRRATQDSRKRMRSKLIKFKRLYDSGKMNMSDIRTAYQSWRGNYRRRFYAYHTIRRMDALFNALFIKNNMEGKNHGKCVCMEGWRKADQPHGLKSSGGSGRIIKTA